MTYFAFRVEETLLKSKIRNRTRNSFGNQSVRLLFHAKLYRRFGSFSKHFGTQVRKVADKLPDNVRKSIAYSD